MLTYISIFVLSCLILIVSGNWLIKSLDDIAHFFGLKKFTVAFLLMSLATASPEMFIGISSAIRGVPELSLGNILGQNIIHFTVAVFLCVLIKGSFSVRNKTTRISAMFSGFMALFPLILILDGTLSRSDGVTLILLFCAYSFWMIKKSHRYDEPLELVHNPGPKMIWDRFKTFVFAIKNFAIGILLLIIASKGIVKSAIFFASELNIPLVIIGVLIVGLGTALPEVFFSAFSARNSNSELMAGNLLGSTVVSTSLVLGVVSIISPITNITLFSYFIGRLALFVSVFLFIYFMFSEKKVSWKESLVLLSVYVAFITLEIFF